MGLQHRRPDQLEPVGVGQPHLHLYVRGIDTLPQQDERDEALEQVLQARLLPLRELLCEPLDRWQANLLRRTLGKGLRALRRQRRHAVDRPRRLPRLHDAGGRGRPRVRRRLRRRPPRLQREDRPGALAAHRVPAESSARRSSSASSSSSPRSSSGHTPQTRRRERSPGRSVWASTRPGSPPTATTTSR